MSDMSNINAFKTVPIMRGANTSSDSEESRVVHRKKVQKPSKQEWNRRRKFLNSWTCPEESKLIAAVQKRRALWDGNCPEHKMKDVKRNCWKEVAIEFGIEGVDAAKAKLKWNSMRSNFKSYLAKYRAEVSAQGERDEQAAITVSWPHFEEMLFLETGEVVEQSMERSTLSSPDQPPTQNDSSQSFNISARDPPPPPAPVPKPQPQPASQPEQAAPEPDLDQDPDSESKTPYGVGKHQKRKIDLTQTPPPTPEMFFQPDMKDWAELIMYHMNHRQADLKHRDRFTAFGEVIAGHLRELPPTYALALESRLSATMYEFLGAIRPLVTTMPMAMPMPMPMPMPRPRPPKMM